MHVSLDGFVRGPDGDMGWVDSDEEVRKWELGVLWDAGVHVMGRATYLEMAQHWPSSTRAFAAPMNEIPKVVFSRTLRSADWTGSRIASGDLAQEVAALRQQDGKDILAHGGGSFAQSLSREGLVDRYKLIVHPIALGSGLALFSDRIQLQLGNVRRFATGAFAATYERG